MLFLLFLNFKIHVVIGGVVLYDVIFRVCVSVAFYGLFDALIYGLNRMLHENTQTHRHTGTHVDEYVVFVSLYHCHAVILVSLPLFIALRMCEWLHVCVYLIR